MRFELNLCPGKSRMPGHSATLHPKFCVRRSPHRLVALAMRPRFSKLRGHGVRVPWCERQLGHNVTPVPVGGVENRIARPLHSPASRAARPESRQDFRLPLLPPRQLCADNSTHELMCSAHQSMWSYLVPKAWIRTGDISITDRALYQLSYKGIVCSAAAVKH